MGAIHHAVDPLGTSVTPPAPEIYTLYDYIESHGSEEKILLPQFSWQVKIDAHVKFEKFTSDSGCVFGASFLVFTYSNTYHKMYVNNQGNYINGNPRYFSGSATLIKNLVHYTPTQFSYGASVSATYNIALTTNMPLYIFITASYAKLWAINICDLSDNLLFDLRPAIRNEDNVPGMYDTVNGVFYFNATVAAHTLTVGND